MPENFNSDVYSTEHQDDMGDVFGTISLDDLPEDHLLSDPFLRNVLGNSEDQQKATSLSVVYLATIILILSLTVLLGYPNRMQNAMAGFMGPTNAAPAAPSVSVVEPSVTVQEVTDETKEEANAATDSPVAALRTKDLKALLPPPTSEQPIDLKELGRYGAAELDNKIVKFSSTTAVWSPKKHLIKIWFFAEELLSRDKERVRNNAFHNGDIVHSQYPYLEVTLHLKYQEDALELSPQRVKYFNLDFYKFANESETVSIERKRSYKDPTLAIRSLSGLVWDGATIAGHLRDQTLRDKKDEDSNVAWNVSFLTNMARYQTEDERNPSLLQNKKRQLVNVGIRNTNFSP